MTTEEFSNEFDTLLNSYLITAGFGKDFDIHDIALNEYEKSVMLTKSQEEIIVELYNGNNNSRHSFEETEENRRYLGNLIKTYNTAERKTGYEGISGNSVFFGIPDDLWFITYESVIVNEKNECFPKELMVVPVTQDDYYRTARNPFRKDSERRALRLDADSTTVEIITEYDISKYTVKYMSKPDPIILTDLPEGLSINGINTKTECKLSPAIHRTILDRAVKMTLLNRPGIQAVK